MIFNRVIPTLLVLLVAAAPATRPTSPLLARDDAALDAPIVSGPRIVCLSESCRAVIPTVRQVAIEEGWRSVCVIFREGGYVYPDGVDPVWIVRFEEHAAECWPDAAIVYVENEAKCFDDDEES